MKLLIILSLFVAFSGAACSQNKPETYKTVSVQEAQAMLQKDSSLVLLDVRTKEEFEGETGHLAKAILLPVQELESRIAQLAPYKEKTLLVYCRSGRRSAAVCETLSKQGFKAMNVAGGIIDWNKAGYPTQRGGK